MSDGRDVDSTGGGGAVEDAFDRAIEPIQSIDWCERVGAAIVDGRVFEDPGFWRPHVESCTLCRPRVEGLLALRDLIEDANVEAPVADPAPHEGMRSYHAGVGRFQSRQRNRRIAGGLGALLLVCGTALAFTSTKDEPSRRDPIEYAESLYERIYKDPAHPDFELVKRDPEFREECLRALDDSSSLVRRTALVALALGNVHPSASQLARALDDWGTRLEQPLEVASATGGLGAIAEKIEAQRVSTVSFALLSASSLPITRRLSASRITRFLGDPAPGIRQIALIVLSDDPQYVPGDEVVAMLARDTDETVRVQAAHCLMKRLQSAGASLVVSQLKKSRDDSVEEKVLPLIQGFPELATPFAHERVADSNTPVRVALQHELFLVDGGDRAPQDRLLLAALSDGDSSLLRDVVLIAAAADFATVRDRVQDAWIAAPRRVQSQTAAPLVEWDLRSGKADRLALALDICESLRDPRLRSDVAQLAESDATSIRRRAAALLNAYPQKQRK